MITEKGKKLKKRKFLTRFNRVKRGFLFILSMIGYIGYILINSLTRTERLTYNIGEGAEATVFVSATLLFVGWFFFYNLDKIRENKRKHEKYEEDDGDYYEEE